MLGRLILFGIASYFAYRFVRETLAKPEQRAFPKSSFDMLTGSDMVKDPQCGTYIVKEKSVIKRIGEENVHFCSEECANQYLTLSQ